MHASMAINNGFLTSRDLCVAEVILCEVSRMALLSHSLLFPAFGQLR
jgi:hypothetical protein